MTNRAAATRYARALFDLGLSEKRDIVQLQDGLTGFAELVAGNESLARVLANPAIPAARKRGVVEHLLAQAGDMQPTLKKLLLLLAERDRLVLLPDVAEAFRNRVMDHQKVVRAELVTAVALPKDRVAALSDGLARATGRQVRLETRVDPALIGGAVTKIGSTVYDGSITRQLEKMKEALTSEATE